jgi:hypothetical protein
MATKTKAKTKGMGSLKHSGKGPVHHVEIHPAKNADGSQGFTTKVFRGRTPEQEKAMHDPKGRGQYFPEQSEDKDAETIHPDGVDMIDHVKGMMGVQDEDPDNEQDGDDSAGEGAY